MQRAVFTITSIQKSQITTHIKLPNSESDHWSSKASIVYPEWWFYSVFSKVSFPPHYNCCPMVRNVETVKGGGLWRGQILCFHTGHKICNSGRPLAVLNSSSRGILRQETCAQPHTLLTMILPTLLEKLEGENPYFSCSTLVPLL